MESLCMIRDIYRSIAEFENQFSQLHNISLNEGMLLCSILKSERLSSGEIAELLGLTNSNASKVIASAEKKLLIRRVMGDKDKRRMYFSLTNEGEELINKVKCEKFELPDILKSVIK